MRSTGTSDAATRRRVVFAPDSFKGSLSATDAADALAAGWTSVRPRDHVVSSPQADGGEGTMDAIARATDGALVRPAGVVEGPDGRPVEGRWLQLPDGTGVVELAQMSGLPLMRAPDAMGATSRGLGQVIAAALDAGADRLLIGLGGSASTDAGIPVLDALGGRRLPARGALLLTDVTAPLLGPRGAATVFGPQKGASPADVERLERRLEAAAAVLGGDPAAPGAGAAGGVGFGLASWGAAIVRGAEFVAEITGLEGRIAEADLVVTGEGSFDHQSLLGKTPGLVLELAARHGVPAVVVAGRVAPGSAQDAVSLSELAGSPEAAMAEPRTWLQEAGAMLARRTEDRRRR